MTGTGRCTACSAARRSAAKLRPESDPAGSLVNEDGDRCLELLAEFDDGVLEHAVSFDRSHGSLALSALPEEVRLFDARITDIHEGLTMRTPSLVSSSPRPIRNE